MEEIKVSAFGGVIGRVLRDSMAVGTAITGVALGALLLGSGFIFGLVGADGLGMVFGQIVVAVALARFALNGMAGESSGTVFSTVGGSWPMALAVAGRYLVLNLIWIVPLLFLGLSLIGSAANPAAVGSGGSMTTGSASGGSTLPGGPAGPGAAGGLSVMLPILAVLTSKAFIAAAVIFVVGMAVLPPIFLIVAVRSERFGQIFSTVLWSNTFSGRLGDLYAIYVVHGGALGMLVILALPALLLTFAAGKEIGILCLAIGLSYSGGLAITLLGRLCGFFAFGEELAGPLPASQITGGSGHEPAGSRGRPRPPEIFGAPETAIDQTGGAAVFESPGAGAVAHSEFPVHPAVAPTTGRKGTVPLRPVQGSGGAAVGEPRLPDLSQAIAEARARFASDPNGALERLLELREQNPGHPQVLHAAVLCLQKAGRSPEAVLVAREAVPVCLDRGEAVLAGEIFAAVWKQARELELQHEQIDAVATALAKSGDHSRAITAYGIALQMDHGDRKAIKGLLQLADHKMHREGRPKDAIRIYTFLLQYAGDTPFAEDIRLGLADAESRLARAA